MEQPILSLNDIKTGKYELVRLYLAHATRATADNILVTIVKLTVFILNILGQALQNITLPLALSSRMNFASSVLYFILTARSSDVHLLGVHCFRLLSVLHDCGCGIRRFH